MSLHVKSLLRNSYQLNHHPLTNRQKARTWVRFLHWQVVSRLAGHPIAVPFVNGSRLLVSNGMTGATGNIYCGLHEFEEMAFLGHLLLSEDTFVDVGANIGSYSILASAVSGCRTYSFEPNLTTFDHLLDNVYLNRLHCLVEAENVAVGQGEGVLQFTTGLDTMNHVLADGEQAPRSAEVRVISLDSLNLSPTIIKIDVEGYEAQVLDGAMQTLIAPPLLAVIMETNGSGMRYGRCDNDLLDRMMRIGFHACTYDPFHRALRVISPYAGATPNCLLVRDVDAASERCRHAPPLQVLGRLV